MFVEHMNIGPIIQDFEFEIWTLKKLFSSRPPLKKKVELKWHFQLEIQKFKLLVCFAGLATPIKSVYQEQHHFATPQIGLVRSENHSRIKRAFLNLETFKIGIFWRSDFKWSNFQVSIWRVEFSTVILDFDILYYFPLLCLAISYQVNYLLNYSSICHIWSQRTLNLVLAGIRSIRDLNRRDFEVRVEHCELSTLQPAINF